MLCISIIHAERVVAFPLQQWLLKRAIMFRLTDVAYLIVIRLIIQKCSMSWIYGLRAIIDSFDVMNEDL
jgi:hypothetical protein